MISKSKQLKYEKQNERDKTLDLTEKLDAQWKEMRFLIAGSKALRSEEDKERQANEEEKPKEKNDYDCLVRSLQFEMKAHATDKLKSPEELEREKQILIKKAEQALLKRMSNNDDHLEDLKKNHRSVDDMDYDDFNLNDKQANNKRKNDDEQLEAKESSENEDEKEESDEEDEDEDESVDEEEDDEENINENETEWLKTYEAKVDELNNQKMNTNEFNKYLQTLIKSLNPGLNENNKDHLTTLVEQLIELYKAQSLASPINKNLMNILSKTIFQIAQTYLKERTEAIFVNVLRKLHENFDAKNFPKLDTVGFKIELIH